MYIYICIYIYVYVYVYVCIHTCCVYIYACMYVYIHTCIYTHTYIHTYMHTYIRIYVNMLCILYVYMYIYMSQCNASKTPPPPPPQVMRVWSSYGVAVSLRTQKMVGLGGCLFFVIHLYSCAYWYLKTKLEDPEELRVFLAGAISSMYHVICNT